MQVSLKTVIVFIVALITHISSFAQSKQEVFSSIQALLSKATGEKLKADDIFAKEQDKLTKQVFTEKEITVYKKSAGKKDYQWVRRATEIPWNDFFDYDIYTEFSNSDLQIVKLNFKKTFKSEYFASDDDGDEDPSTYTSLEVYVLTKDKSKLDQLLTQLYSFKEKKAESPFNAQIRKFTKEQTLNWLNKQLQEHVRLGGYDSDGQIVSLDACKLVITYRGLVRKYEEVLPTDIKAINKYGKFEYSSAKASIRTTTPDRFDNGEITMHNFSSSVHISDKNEEVMENIECALKHLASFCGNSSSGSNSSAYNTVLQEGFSNNNFNWLEGENNEYRFKVEGGKYSLQTKAGGYWFTTRPVSFNSAADFEISARIKKVSGTDGYYFGLVLGYSLSSKYHHFAGITGQGNAVFANKGDNPADLIPGSIYNAVHKGNASNVITIRKIKNKVMLLVNGDLIGETNYQPFYGNWFGFELWAGNSTLSLEVDELSMKIIE